MYCQNCGTKTTGSEKFCPECGQPMGQGGQAPQGYVEHRVVHQARRKEPIIAVVLNLFLFPGLGQIYAGKPQRFLLVIVLFIGSVGFLLMGIASGSFNIMYIIAPLVVGYWQVYDGYKCVVQYNKFLETHGRAPNGMDDW